MKTLKALIKITVTALSFGIVVAANLYPIFAFAELKLNPLEWGSVSRIAWIIPFVIFVFLGGAISWEDEFWY